MHFHSGLALEASCISETLRQKEQPDAQQWERWKGLIAAASLTGFLQQSDEQRAAEQLLGESVTQNNGQKNNWKPQVLNALSAYKV